MNPPGLEAPEEARGLGHGGIGGGLLTEHEFSDTGQSVKFEVLDQQDTLKGVKLEVLDQQDPFHGFEFEGLDQENPGQGGECKDVLGDLVSHTLSVTPNFVEQAISARKRKRGEGEEKEKFFSFLNQKEKILKSENGDIGVKVNIVARSGGGPAAAPPPLPALPLDLLHLRDERGGGDGQAHQLPRLPHQDQGAREGGAGGAGAGVQAGGGGEEPAPLPLHPLGVQVAGVQGGGVDGTTPLLSPRPGALATCNPSLFSLLLSLFLLPPLPLARLHRHLRNAIEAARTPEEPLAGEDGGLPHLRRHVRQQEQATRPCASPGWCQRPAALRHLWKNLRHATTPARPHEESRVPVPLPSV